MLAAKLFERRLIDVRLANQMAAEISDIAASARFRGEVRRCHTEAIAHRVWRIEIRIDSINLRKRPAVVEPPVMLLRFAF